MAKKMSGSGVFTVLVLVFAMTVTSPIAEAQLGLGLIPNLPGLLPNLGGGNAPTGGLGNLLGPVTGGLGNLLGGTTGGIDIGAIIANLLRLLGLGNQITGSLFQISGRVVCSVNASTSAPPFANATVLLVCNRTAVASTTTNSDGSFNIFLNPVNTNLTSLLQNCRLVVTTPLATCNATLPSTGGLVASLQATGTSIIGTGLTLVRIIPLTFQYVQDLLAVLLPGN